MTKLEFFFDCSSPWSYLAFHNIQSVAGEFDVPIIWRPIIVGGVFNAVNQSVYETRANPVPQKAAYQEKDLADWARVAGLTLLHLPSIFPVNSVKAMRGCIYADEQGLLVPFATAVCEAYWRDDRDIADDAVLAEICDAVGLDKTGFFEKIATQEYKDKLRANTDELIARGGFGSPTTFIDDNDMYFGNDRMAVIRAALIRART